MCSLFSSHALYSCNVSIVTNNGLGAGDIGGDMNHVHRVHLKIIQLSKAKGEKGLQEEEEEDCNEFFSVIVKTAPKEVLVSSGSFSCTECCSKAHCFSLF